jgi:hypothetical protein
MRYGFVRSAGLSAVALAVLVAGCGDGDSGSGSNTGSMTDSGSGSAASTGSDAGQQNGGQPGPDQPCDDEGAQTGMENGTLICTVTDGGLRWQPQMQPSGPGSSESQSDGEGNGTMMFRIGGSCPEDGAIGFSGGGLSFCDNGTGRYALPADLPPAPAGGYTERPAWYPRLADMFGPTVSECPAGSVAFTHPVVPNDQLAPSMPHGMMIFDHVTPIDHMYIGIAALLKDPEARTDADTVPVTAPADGTIIEVSSLGSPTSHRVVISHGCDLVSVYMVLNTLTGVLADVAAQVDAGGQVQVSIPVRAGDEFGRQRDNPLDFNIFDGTGWLTGLANPYSYAFGEAWKPYTVDPFPYLSPEVRDPLEASVQRVVEPRWGPIDHDVIGTASGSWFLDGTIGYSGLPIADVAAATQELMGGTVAGKKSYAYGHLSISPHPVDPARWIFSIGAWPDQSGDPHQLAIDLADGQPEPDQLTAATGAVVYRLAEANNRQPDGYERVSSMAPDGIGYTVDAGPQVGWVVVQVLGDQTLAIEISTDLTALPTGFGDGRITYHR